MNSILTAISNFFESLSRARYAAELTRNGKWAEVQKMYKND